MNSSPVATVSVGESFVIIRKRKPRGVLRFAQDDEVFSLRLNVPKRAGRIGCATCVLRVNVDNDERCRAEGRCATFKPSTAYR